MINQNSLLQSLYKAYPSAALFTVVPGFSKTPSVSREVEQKIPKLLTAWLFERMVAKLHCFFTKYLLPELMTQKLKFSMNAADDDELENEHEAITEDDKLEHESADDEPELYWYCRAAEMEGSPMIACDASDCPIEWFHFSCVSITSEPDSDEEWYCDECKSKLHK